MGMGEAAMGESRMSPFWIGFCLGGVLMPLILAACWELYQEYQKGD